MHSAAGFEPVVAVPKRLSGQKIPEFAFLDDFLADRQDELEFLVQRQIAFPWVEKLIDVSGV